MKLQKKTGAQDFDPKLFLAKADNGTTVADYPKTEHIFVQGDAADAVLYIHKGKIKLTVVSRQGKEAVIAILGAGDFFGEGCLAGQVVRMASVHTMSACSIVRLDKAPLVRLLREEPAFSEMFLMHLLSRNIRF